LWDSVTAWSRAAPFLEQPSPRKIVFILNDLNEARNGVLGICTSRRAARWGNARHRLKHAAKRPPPAGPPEAHAEFFFAAGANSTNMRQWLSTRHKRKVNDSSPSKVHRRESRLATVSIKPDMCTLPR
jgi:hypothetical protein